MTCDGREMMTTILRQIVGGWWLKCSRRQRRNFLLVGGRWWAEACVSAGRASMRLAESGHGQLRIAVALNPAAAARSIAGSVSTVDE